ncbi:SAM-dependent methyltransferase [Micromonospora sp. NBC_01813]|uniref:SAM-dependent methyltransferase n=1 Tax=Micromonospora sp. NBC_01813 TaxID=2975988 RepID=UPI002DD97D78|nr:SAM-dependent methyltransferase [Micromonospora sp. NBC_01813]WSA11710.1 SAM-dependent methyltransferase [Micromonospora sp. NBC_01813]
MTEQAGGAPPAGVDLGRPSAARVYDFFLGGAHNFEVDRQLAAQIAAMTPHLAETMRAGRAFLRRAVRTLLAEGIDQFLDIGSGIPTVGNVHEVAHAVAPAATVLYVDIDPVAVAHSRSILADVPQAAVIQADLRDPDAICEQAAASGLIDFTRPVAILLAGVTHFIPDADDPQNILRRLRSRAVPGSHLVISHATFEDQPPEVLAAQRLSARTDTEITLRSKAEITAMFGDFTILEPGIVHLPLWRPDAPADVDERPERFGAFGGVARRDDAAG